MGWGGTERGRAREGATTRGRALSGGSGRDGAGWGGQDVGGAMGLLERMRGQGLARKRRTYGPLIEALTAEAAEAAAGPGAAGSDGGGAVRLALERARELLQDSQAQARGP
jgi:hypothetical protein